MAYVKLHCETCGGEWEVYGRDIKDDKARQCPHCTAKIDRQMWEREVIPAYEAVKEANAALFTENACRHRPLFTFDVVADHLYQNRHKGGDLCPLIEQLKSFEDFIRA